MKTLCTLLLIAVSFSAIAQRSSNKHVTTDGRQLRIRVDIEQADRSIHFNRSFDVEDMDESAVKALENHVIDSLDRVMNNQTATINIDRNYTDRPKRKHKDERIVYTTSTSDESVDGSLQASASSSLSPSDVAPSSVLVKEDKENGRLWMQYTFEKDGEELIIERTANVVGKSDREKQAIIKETERSFGIKTGNQ
ncbi:hypothetical protein [Spirosoma validum]|uniref:DUF4136 domain-containing protein n=1 Tax=Spirosoma validum TaxID=2771355 RepID=A0A927AXI5_9BACT|nr:hypothetical protein [Spirosoma validum]MBD2751593.1 hypothetical protein [Spirosoma validum]